MIHELRLITGGRQYVAGHYHDVATCKEALSSAPPCRYEILVNGRVVDAGDHDPADTRRADAAEERERTSHTQ